MIVLLLLAVPGAFAGCVQEPPFAQEELGQLSGKIEQLSSQQNELRELVEQLRGELEADKNALGQLAADVAQLRADVDRLKSVPRASEQPVVQAPPVKTAPDPVDRWMEVAKFRIAGSGRSSEFIPQRTPWRITTRVAVVPSNPAATKVQVMQDQFGRGLLKANQSRVFDIWPNERYYCKVDNGEGGAIDFLVESLVKHEHEDE
jgi:outer membrane murein-binding lipoprotein Lpp